MTLDERLAVLVVRLEADLRRDFPGWWIRRGESGDWIAIRKGYGVIVASSSVELREKIRVSVPSHGVR